MKTRLNRTLIVLAASVGLAVLTTLPALAAGYEKSFSFDADQLVVANLVGEVTVVGHAGSDFEVVVNVQGDDAREGDIDFRVTDGGKSRMILKYPKSRRYSYPKMRGSTTVQVKRYQEEKGNFLSQVLGAMTGDSVKISNRGGGLEVWADVTIRVPNSRFLKVYNGVGEMMAAEVSSSLYLDSSSGKVAARDIQGDVEIDTGSGAVDVSGILGELIVDTGSGGVRVSSVEGRSVEVDTGSGSVSAENIIADYVEVDTGSGRVKARGISADSAEIDTGSGSVTLELDSMGTGDFNIDTGSGSIDLLIPGSASADVVADTGSGGIDINVSGADVVKTSRDHARFRVGSGQASVRLDTGSGSIHVSGE